MDNLEIQIKDYLNNLLMIPFEYGITPEDQKIIDRSLGSFIIKKLLRKRFRKQKVHPDTLAEITNKVNNKIEQNKPIHFTIPFGGYKHFWNPSYPEPDWAEVFTIRFLSEWVAPILAAYKPGAIIEFISEDVILSRMNNYPNDALEKYSEIFRSLIDLYQKWLPANLKLNYFRVNDKCDGVKIVKEVENLLPKRWQEWEKLNNSEKAIELKRSMRSVFWNGKENLINLSSKEKEKRTIESRLIELAYYDVEALPKFLGNYFTDDNRIGICFSFGLSPDNITHWITLGSTYASVVDYWIGRGVLEKMENGFIPRIVSKEQYEKIKAHLKTLSLKDELPFKNYQSIEVIGSKDWTYVSNASA